MADEPSDAPEIKPYYHRVHKVYKRGWWLLGLMWITDVVLVFWVTGLAFAALVVGQALFALMCAFFARANRIRTVPDSFPESMRRSVSFMPASGVRSETRLL